MIEMRDEPVYPKKIYEEYENNLEFDKAEKFPRAMHYFKKGDCKRVLDIGCGKGTFGVKLKQKLEIDVYGIDISEKSINIAKKNIVAKKINIDKEDLPFKDSYFDGVFCGDVIEHLFDTDHLFREIRRVLKRSGICVITTPNLASWYNRIFLLLGWQPLFLSVSTKYNVGNPLNVGFAPGHVRLFTKRALIELSKKYDFKVVNFEGIGINTKLGVGKKLKPFVLIINMFLVPFPSLASHLLVVLEKK